MIDGVKIKELRVHKDKRGFLFEVLRGSDSMKADGPKAFGQFYVSACYPAVIKGKHLHKKQTDHMTVIKGKAVIHIEDQREGSPTKGEKMAVEVGEENLKLVRIPPNVWHSAENIGTETVYFINYVTREYDGKEPDEYRAPFDPKDRKMPTEPSAIG